MSKLSDSLQAELDRGYTGYELQRMAGVSARCIQWWRERGIIRAKRFGKYRIFTPREALSGLVVTDLRKRGIPMTVARRAARYIRFRKVELRRFLIIDVETNGIINVVDSAVVPFFAGVKGAYLVDLQPLQEQLAQPHPFRKLRGRMRRV